MDITEEDSEEWDRLSRCLTLVRNILKVQHPSHISFLGDGYALHGIENGLTLPPSLDKRPHSSTLYSTKAEVVEAMEKKHISCESTEKDDMIRAIERHEQREEATLSVTGSVVGSPESSIVDSNASSSLGIELDEVSKVGGDVDTGHEYDDDEEDGVSGDDCPDLGPHPFIVGGTACARDKAPNVVVSTVGEDDDSVGDDGLFGMGDAAINAADDDDDSVDPPIEDLTSKFEESGQSSPKQQNDSSGRSDEKEVDGCLPCDFVSWFMLKELPTFLSKFEDDESCNDAKAFVEDSFAKFVLYQGHRVRCKNQNDANAATEEEMIERCRKEKNAHPTVVKLVGDFKMKWEAMYQREFTSQSYGKRGVSWHGFLIIYYVWDEETQEPVRHVLKLDQILEGTNKQDGVTLLALVEAALVYILEEFGEGVVVEVLQTDNAAAYHKKELVLGIPILNAVRSS